jgi:DNA repair exonuclease SbcCD nuclease subunit
MVLGHIHDHKYVGPNWVYPGSLTINNFGEVDEQKGWVEVNLETLAYEWFEFPEDVTPWVHVELDLTEKDETTLDEEKIKELVGGAVVKITVLAKAHGVIDEAAIRKMFSKYGHVSRFETKVTGEITEVTKDKRLTHRELLIEFLAGGRCYRGSAGAGIENGVEDN